MKRKQADISASVLARLKNIAEKDHLDFNFLLVRYAQERFLARLAASGYANNFVLKGGFLLLAYNIAKARPTKDIDFLGIDISSNRKDIERLIKAIAAVDCNDGIRFLSESIKSTSITEDADYEGVRVRILSKIGSARNTIQIDFGFGDVVSPHPMEIDYPSLLDRRSFKVLAYAKETIVAEKFEALVKLTTFKPRLKDFYDISFLASEFDFDGSALQTALKNTFKRRGTSLKPGREILQSDFGNQPPFQGRWEAFTKRTRLDSKKSFKDIFEEMRLFLLPIVDAELEGSRRLSVWRRNGGRWE